VEVGISLASATPWPTADAYTLYGSCTNLWSASWTPNDINAASFGLVFASIDYSCASFNVHSFIDHVRVSVCYDMTLPTNILEFKATRKDNQIELNWNSNSGSSDIKYIAQRSEDGFHFQSFDSLATNHLLKSNGLFSIIDHHPISGINYYRLISVTENGELDYSNIVSARFVREQHFSVANPIVHMMELPWLMEIEEPVNIYLINSMGVIVYEEVISEKPSSYKRDLSNLPNGIYYLKIVNSHYSETNKLIKISY